ncbi:exodeoxyribonuclease V subunit beta [Marinobacterium arenosum]|uniref:exodeoxyribonuclease V subunit beta n=1 Tax=Marinobacterium arenosum TaxID=2862496 RepID=UPI001C9841D5|nr:exodeoxyribonuclease V subunit beta [Marinobacterium arenosum]MBY4678197.1 exodeoxyribonuclease V subunit beta [Marinobacterium arenosum]
MTDALKLEPLSFPLTGLQLIEASAGTGKTYTITALYLRLLLGLSEASDGKPLGPEQILVVTFTEAATEELRDRIRSRISEARRAFQRGQAADPLIQTLVDSYPERERAVALLEMASRQMDEAAIFTIHGFCQRMLRQHAFESGGLFETELITDETPWLRQALLDFWRRTLYRLPDGIGVQLLSHWPTPDELLSELRAYLHTPQLQLRPNLADNDLVAAYRRRAEQLQAFRSVWRQNQDDLAALIAGSGVNKRSYTKKRIPEWLAKVDEFVAGEGEPSKDQRKALERFSQPQLDEASASNPPQHTLFEQVEALLAGEVPLREMILQRAFGQVQRSLAQAKAEQRLLAFDDLLSGLDRALQSDGQGLLAQAIRSQFPVALIDEFQDTDPLQYRIFSSLYTDRPGCGLIMIGDPKQAIYAFRGADIFTYIQARRSVAQPYTLDTNWRSTQAMISAVNRLFQQCPAPFIYDADIPFQPVRAAGKADKTPMTQAGRPLPALQFWHCDQLLSRGDYRSRYAAATACEIERLLAGDVQIGQAPLQAGEIAVLVRDRYEADAIRDALAERQIPCVYLSNRDSVFASAEAVDLYRILLAVQEPNDERALRAALACPLLQLDVPALETLNSDEQAWEAAVNEFGEYRDCWLRLGVLPMLHRLIHRRQLAVQLLQQPGGERRLTDLLHLGELLQQASTRIEGLAGLLRWLVDQLHQAGGAADDQLLRLESDRNLVTVVTIHKSKGLEYPVVFLPFASDFRAARSAFFHDEGLPVWSLDNNEEDLAKADGERLAEELRLLYVALTRAVYRCYVGVTDLKVGNARSSQLHRSALGHLLQRAERELPDALAALDGEAHGIAVDEPPQSVQQAELFASAEQSPAAELQARRFDGQINRDWRLSSYSALSQGGAHSGGHGAAAVAPEVVMPGLDLEVAAERLEQPVSDDEQDSIYSFPRGARAGTFLHSLFEELSFDRQGDDEAADWLAHQLVNEGYDPDQNGRWQSVLLQLRHDVLQADLDGNGLRLAGLSDDDRQVEMEFMLPVERLDAGRLNRLLRQHDPLSGRAGELQFEQLKGMLKGFIDLVFRVDGRYYIADYKSNHLGDRPEDYSGESLAQAMIEHRYDLQYQLYSLALHRLLAQRLPDYQPERHFGGVFYLFLRGMQAGSGNGVYFSRPDSVLIEQLDRMFHGGAE